MNLKEIKEVINLMTENDLAEIEIEREGLKLKIKKFSQDIPEPLNRKPVEYHAETQYTPPSAPAAGQNSAKLTKVIASPMVGTFYRSPSPEAPPFVEVGQVVEVGQIVCIVEAMKLMNEIKSEVRGRVVEIAVDNAEPVEFGQTLFVVEPL